MQSLRTSSAHQAFPIQFLVPYPVVAVVQGGWRIGYSYFATAVGAWCIAAPSSFAVYSGILGLAMYAVAAGLPVLILSLCGSRIVRRFPTVSSIGGEMHVRMYGVREMEISIAYGNAPYQ